MKLIDAVQLQTGTYTGGVDIYSAAIMSVYIKSSNKHSPISKGVLFLPVSSANNILDQ